MTGLHPIYLRSAGSVQRALPGQACKVENGKPVVHDARESFAYHGKKIWV